MDAALVLAVAVRMSSTSIFGLLKMDGRRGRKLLVSMAIVRPNAPAVYNIGAIISLMSACPRRISSSMESANKIAFVYPLFNFEFSSLFPSSHSFPPTLTPIHSLFINIQQTFV